MIGPGEMLARIVLVVLGIIALDQLARGQFRAWARAKFLNAPPAPDRPPGFPGAGEGRSGSPSRFVDPVPGGQLVGVWGDPRDGGRRRHKGIDLAAACGSPVRAAATGTASRVGSGGRLCGKRVAIAHGGGWETLYCHLAGFTVRQGDRVTAGQQIATMGATGNAQGCHLHFEIRVNGQAIDPLPHVR